MKIQDLVRSIPPPSILDKFNKVKHQVLEALGRGDALHEETKAERLLNAENEEDLDIVDILEGLYTEPTL